MALCPRSIRMKHPDGLESASKRPLWGIRTHSATSPKRLPKASGVVKSRFFCGRQPRHLVAPLSSEGMPLLAVELADNRTSCPAVAKSAIVCRLRGLRSCFWPCFPAKPRRIASYVRFAAWLVRRIACFVLGWPIQAILRARDAPPDLRARDAPPGLRARNLLLAPCVRNRAARLLCAIMPLLCRCWRNRHARRTMDVFKTRLYCRRYCPEGGCYGCKGV